MATPSLYRRYRPRRFGELKGQDHVVRALRDAVAGGREGQAYLFSGPRGTGKTTSARILAKVLNCERPVDGEPCCECESCLAVERGTSYDVHELDAASNNGVDAMRDLIEKASLGTPGRHKVYILDEVHMLSQGGRGGAAEDARGAAAARRVRARHHRPAEGERHHPQPHPAPAVPPAAARRRWPSTCAGSPPTPGSTSTEAAIDAAVAQGAGSARDTLSALELIANAGGDAGDTLSFDELVEALIEHDPGRALTAMAHAVNAGHEPRPLAEALVRHLRNGFLSLMAPELVQLSSHQVDALAAQAQRLGPAALVRAIERLGEILVELRHAPDPRVLVEVALVQLTTAPPAASGDDIGPLAARVAALEQALAAGQVPSPATAGARSTRRPVAPRSAGGPGAPPPTPRRRPRRPPPARRAGAEPAAAGPGAGRRRTGRRRVGAQPRSDGDLRGRVGAAQADAAAAWPAPCSRRVERRRRTTATRSRWPRPTRPTAPSASEHRAAVEQACVGAGRPAGHDRAGRRDGRPAARRARRRPAAAPSAEPDDDDRPRRARRRPARHGADDARPPGRGVPRVRARSSGRD